MPLFAAKGMMSSGGGGNFYTLLENSQATKNDTSYRKPSGMFDVATSSSGDVYTLNGQMNNLTGMYNVIVAKFGAIGAISWQYTISTAKNVFPCALACNTSDNSIFICVVETTNLANGTAYNNKRNNDSNSAYNDTTTDAVYRFIKFSSSGTRIWENQYTTTNTASYRSSINTMSSSGATFSNIFENRANQAYEMRSLMGASDLKMVRSAPRLASFTSVNSTTNASVLAHVAVDLNGSGHRSVELAESDNVKTLGVNKSGAIGVHEALATDGPHFGGRPQCTSNIVIDQSNSQFYIGVAANASGTDLSNTRSTFHLLRIPFDGVAIQSRELVYPGGWDQNVRMAIDVNGKLVIPWSMTNKARNMRDQSVSTIQGNPVYYQFFDTGDPGNTQTDCTASYIRYDWNTTDYDFTYYDLINQAPVKVCKVEKEPAPGTTYEYVTTAGLTPGPTVNLGNVISSRTADTHHWKIGRHTNFVQVQKKNIATNALDWVRSFFTIPKMYVRDGNNCGYDTSETGVGSDMYYREGVNFAGNDIQVTDSKVFSNGIYVIGNVIGARNADGYDNTSGNNYESKANYIGFIAKIEFDGTVDYIREIRAGTPGRKPGDAFNPVPNTPGYYYAMEQDGGVLLDSINFDAFNNMIVTARYVSSNNVGSSGHFVRNTIFKLPHNGDLVGPIEVTDASGTYIDINFDYTPATIVRCWDEVVYDLNATNNDNSGLEKYKLLRTCTLWNTDISSATDPSSTAAPTTINNYQATTSISPSRLVTLDTGTYQNRYLWSAPTQNVQLDSTQNRQWDRADRRTTSSMFLQSYAEQTDNEFDTRIEAIASCPCHLYVDQSVATDNAQLDYSNANPSNHQLHGVAGQPNAARIDKQEVPNGLLTLSQYWDGNTGLRTQVLTRHGPTGGIEARAYHTGYNTYPKGIDVDPYGNIYCVGWTANTTGGNNYGLGYIVCYDKDLNYQWDYEITESNSTYIGSAPANFQAHCVSVELNSPSAGVLFVGGHFTQESGGQSTQMAEVVGIRLQVAGTDTGLATPLATTLTNVQFAIGGSQAGNAVDGIFGIDTALEERSPGGGGTNSIKVGYAGKTYDSTGNTTRGMYGFFSVDTSANVMGSSAGGYGRGYIIGDDLQLNKFKWRKGIGNVMRGSGNNAAEGGCTYAVSGSETQAGDTNGIIIVANDTWNASNAFPSFTNTVSNRPHSFSSFTINNSSGADTIKDIVWGHNEVPGIQDFALNTEFEHYYYNDTGFGQGGISNSTYAHHRFNPHEVSQDKLYAVASITNQFNQLDTYICEITTAGVIAQSVHGNVSAAHNKSVTGCNITRIGKLSTSGITEPAGVAVLGHQYGTLMFSMNAANSGTPNDRHLLTAKLPMDLSKKQAAYHTVGPLSVVWDERDTSINITGQSMYALEINQAEPGSSNDPYRDGTRFFYGAVNATTMLNVPAGSVKVNDITNLGTFNAVTQELQTFTQS